MSDLRIEWDAEIGGGDLRIAAPDLAGEDTLRTAVLVSIFTDRRASLDELPVGEVDRRGWWGDALAEVDGDQIGSKLWLLRREKETREVLSRAEGYVRDALAWMIEDEVATSIETEASWVRRGEMRLRARLTLPSGHDVEYDFSTRLETL